MPQFFNVLIGDMSEGESITITHKDITRYFMTIPETNKLVITAGELAKRGEIFVWPGAQSCAPRPKGGNMPGLVTLSWTVCEG